MLAMTMTSTLCLLLYKSSVSLQFLRWSGIQSLRCLAKYQHTSSHQFTLQTRSISWTPKQRHDSGFIQPRCFYILSQSGINYSTNSGHATDLSRDKNNAQNEFAKLKQILDCKDKELISIYQKLPRLKYAHIHDQVVNNLIVLQEFDISPRILRQLMVYRTTAMAQITPEDLRFILNAKFGVNKYCNSIGHIINTHVLKGYDDQLHFLADLLEVPKNIICAFQCQNILDRVGRSSLSAHLIKEKVEYLLDEGFKKREIVKYIKILSPTMKTVSEALFHTRQEFGEEVSLPLLMFKLKLSKGDACKVKSGRVVTRKLGWDYMEFSKLERNHLNKVDPVQAIEMAMYLMRTGYSEDDIKSCIYVLGNSLETFRKAYKELQGNPCVDSVILEDRKKLLNALQYYIETSS